MAQALPIHKSISPGSFPPDMRFFAQDQANKEHRDVLLYKIFHVDESVLPSTALSSAVAVHNKYRRCGRHLWMEPG
jgi:hypothetical protein